MSRKSKLGPTVAKAKGFVEDLPSVASKSDSITAFRGRIHEWKNVWGAIDVRCICFKQDDGWRNAHTTVRLLAGEPSEYGPMEVTYDDDQFGVLHEISSINRFEALI